MKRYLLIKNMKKLITAALILSASISVHASTATEYESTCKYIDSSKNVRFSGKCAVNFGIVGAAGKSVRYILTFPKGNEVTFFVFGNGTASANGVPSKSVKNSKQLMHIVTGEEEEYLFSSPSPDSM